MHQIRPQKPALWNPRYSRVATFVGAVLLHLIVFLLIATYVVFRAVPPPADATFIKVPLQPPTPPPVTPPAMSGGAAANNLEPDVTTTPLPIPQSVITSVKPTFTANTSAVNLPNLPAMSANATGSALANSGASGDGSGNGSFFGSRGGNPSGLFEGYLYDFKQTADRKPTGMTSDQYRTILLQLISGGWDESILSRYYKSPTPIFTSQILVPDIDANEGPKAFGADKDVQPKLWAVWYKARLSPPQSGVYRFAGFADDELLVRVDGQTVLDGSIVGIARGMIRHTPWPNDWVENRLPDQNYGQLREGVPVNLTQGIAVDIDVIIGEDPGGQFNASLFAVRDGEDYPKDKNGVPMLPLLQSGKADTQFSGVHPPINPTPALWTP